MEGASVADRQGSYESQRAPFTLQFVFKHPKSPKRTKECKKRSKGAKEQKTYNSWIQLLV